jgi:hypothetical protein
MSIVVEMSFIDRILTAASFVSAGLALAAPASATGTEPEVQARWEVDHGRTKCRLIRHFRTADQSYRLEVERGWSFGGYDWTLYGEELPVYSSATTITIALEPSATTHRFKTNPYMFDEGDARGIGWNDPDNLLVGALRHEQHISMTGTKKLSVALDLSNASSALKTLEACEDDLFAGWGFDASQVRSLSAPVKPSNYPGRWITNDDYPRADLASENEGTTTFLLNVGANGSATGCRIIDSSGFPSLDKRTCELLLGRTAFHPARDGAGGPVPSFYVNRILWRVPR